MTLKQELVKRIKDYFNLNIYETKVWLALLTKGMASAGEIAEISGVPRSRTYDVLESLEKQGFALQKIGKPVKYLAVKPLSVIDKLKKNAMREMDEKMATLSNIKDTDEYKELEGLHNSKTELIKKQDISGTIKGRLNINNHITDTFNTAKKEIVICTSIDEFKKRLKLFEPALNQLRKSKVKLNIALYGEDKEIADLNKRLGIKIKKSEIDSSFYITDKSEILFMLNKSEDTIEQMAVWFLSPFFVNSFVSLFDLALDKK